MADQEPQPAHDFAEKDPIKASTFDHHTLAEKEDLAPESRWYCPICGQTDIKHV
ncbi:hypothetical protein BGX23_000686, partial [Mortierella sp. AD031]